MSLADVCRALGQHAIAALVERWDNAFIAVTENTSASVNDNSGTASTEGGSGLDLDLSAVQAFWAAEHGV